MECCLLIASVVMSDANNKFTLPPGSSPLNDDTTSPSSSSNTSTSTPVNVHLQKMIEKVNNLQLQKNSSGVNNERGTAETTWRADLVQRLQSYLPPAFRYYFIFVY